MARAAAAFLAFLIFLSMLATCSYSGTKCHVNSRIQSEDPVLQATPGFELHDPILITGNEGFLNRVLLDGWAGTGTPSEPYLIENYEILCQGTAGITIDRVSLPFAVRNCRIIGTHNGTDNEMYGMSFSFCENVVVDSCYMGNMWNGIRARYSNGTIANSTVEEPMSKSIRLTRCDGMRVHNCLVSTQGIAFEDSESISICENTVRDVVGSGIEIGESWDINCVGNRLLNISDFGIFGAYLYHGNFSENQFTECGTAGIYFYGGDYCTISFNNFTGCGIHLSSSISGMRQYNVQGNLVNGKPIGYFSGLSRTLIDVESYSQVILVGCQDVGIVNGRFFDVSTGVCFSNCYHCTIMDTTIRWNGFFGFRAEYSDHCTAIGLRASQNRIGISLWQSDNCRVESCTIDNSILAAIYSSFADFMSFTNNTIIGTSQNPSQVHVQDANLMTMTDNRFLNAGLMLDMSGKQHIMHIIEGNTVDGKPLLYGSELSDEIIDCSNLGQVLLADCENITLEGGQFQGVPLELLNCVNCSLSEANIHGSFGLGLLSYYSNWTRLENVHVLNASESGILLHASYNSTIRNCTTAGCHGDGMVIRYTHDTIIAANTITGNAGVGLDVDTTSSCILAGNAISMNGGSGIRLVGAVSWTITYNTVVDNHLYGIEILALYEASSSHHTIFSNAIGWNLEGNAIDDGRFNSWDDSIAIGNRWSDYNGTTQWYWVPGSAGSYDRFPSLLRREVPFPIIPVVLGLLGCSVAAIGIGFVWRKGQRIQMLREGTSQESIRE